MNNEKKLTAQDLALYLGCEVEWMGERDYFLSGVNTGQKDFNPVGLVSAQMEPVWVNYEEVIPILRPLSDMMEEEKNDPIWDQNPEFRTFNDLMIATAPVVRYLLSRHFDLFGWIDAGLAIDKIKI